MLPVRILPAARALQARTASYATNAALPTRLLRVPAPATRHLHSSRAADAAAATPQNNGGETVLRHVATGNRGAREKLASVKVRDDWTVKQSSLSLEFSDLWAPDEPGRKLGIPLLWLRDSCPCPACRDPDSGQKNFSTCDLPSRPQMQSATVSPDGALTVVWKEDVLSAGQAHTSTWAAGDVASWRPRRSPSFDRPVQRAPRYLWDRGLIERVLPRIKIRYEEWTAGGKAFEDALIAFAQTGLVFVTGVPESEQSVERIAEQIGLLQQTFYGPTWDVVSKPHAENVAYTSQFLGLHQDLLYLPDTPRVQLLHCLANSCDGGESLFSDGVAVASSLRADKPTVFQALSTSAATAFHYNRNGHRYYKRLPTIEMASPTAIQRVNWAPPFQALFTIPQVLPDGEMDRPRGKVSLLEWKEAAAVFEQTLAEPTNVFEYKMQPGECVVMDNHRILHGRRQFNTASGSRWLKGCYISHATLHHKLNEVLELAQQSPKQYSARLLSLSEQKGAEDREQGAQGVWL